MRAPLALFDVMAKFGPIPCRYACPLTDLAIVVCVGIIILFEVFTLQHEHMLVN